MEIWAKIKGQSEGLEISSFGNLKSIDRKVITSNRTLFLKGKPLKTYLTKKGYLKARVATGKKEQLSSFFVHRAVAEAFIPNPENKPQVNHINGIKTDNRVENLEWVTSKENIVHGHKNLLYNFMGENNNQSKLKETDVKEIKKLLQNPKIKGVNIAAKYNVSKYLISSIKTEKAWKHIK